MDYSEELTQRFLRNYRELESIKDNDLSRFHYYEMKYPREFEGFRLLRNYLSHETFLVNDPIAVSNVVVDSIERILAEMETTCYQRASKDLLYAIPSDKFRFALEQMSKRDFAYLPILDGNKKLLGVISLGDLLDLEFKEKDMIHGNDATVSDLLPYFVLEAEHTEGYAFLRRNDPLYKANQVFAKPYKEGVRYGLIFITEHGRPDERILGIIAPIDLLK